MFNMGKTGTSSVQNKVLNVILPRVKRKVSEVNSAERHQTNTAECCLNPVCFLYQLS